MGQELPAANWLGYSINMLTATPVNIKAVSEAIITGSQILSPDPDEKIREVTIGDTVYDVTQSILVSTDVTSVQGTYITYSSGSEASSAFSANASLSASYLAVSGGASASYSIDKTFTSDNQYAFYSFNGDLYAAKLRNYLDIINERRLKARVETLPKPFDSSDKTVQDYRDFFTSFGSHVIIGTSYGARYQLSVWASRQSSEVNKNFSASVTAAFNGVMASGKFDASITESEQYKEFSNYMQKVFSIQGGDLTLALDLGTDPADYDKYVEWTKTAPSRADLMSIQTIELWVLLKDAISADLRNIANTLREAYEYIAHHPVVYRTKARIYIESDWAEIGMLTPSAIIKEDPDAPLEDPGNTYLGTTKLRWGREHSHVEKRQTIDFLILNDGSPVDFYISHGSDGGEAGKGNARVTMELTNYVNDKITDNNWNTEYFYQASVSRTPAATKARRSVGPRSWETALKEYLREFDRDERIQEV